MKCLSTCRNSPMEERWRKKHQAAGKDHIWNFPVKGGSKNASSFRVEAPIFMGNSAIPSERSTNDGTYQVSNVAFPNMNQILTVPIWLSRQGMALSLLSFELMVPLVNPKTAHTFPWIRDAVISRNHKPWKDVAPRTMSSTAGLGLSSGLALTQIFADTVARYANFFTTACVVMLSMLYFICNIAHCCKCMVTRHFFLHMSVVPIWRMALWHCHTWSRLVLNMNKVSLLNNGSRSSGPLPYQFQWFTASPSQKHGTCYFNCSEFTLPIGMVNSVPLELQSMFCSTTWYIKI